MFIPSAATHHSFPQIIPLQPLELQELIIGVGRLGNILNSDTSLPQNALIHTLRERA